MLSKHMWMDSFALKAGKTYWCSVQVQVQVQHGNKVEHHIYRLVPDTHTHYLSKMSVQCYKHDLSWGTTALLFKWLKTTMGEVGVEGFMHKKSVIDTRDHRCIPSPPNSPFSQSWRQFFSGGVQKTYRTHFRFTLSDFFCHLGIISIRYCCKPFFHAKAIKCQASVAFKWCNNLRFHWPMERLI